MMCYPTASTLCIKAIEAANIDGLGHGQEITIWEKGDVKIILFRRDWDYSAKLRCDGIVSALPVLRCHAGQWVPEKRALKDVAEWLVFVAQRRFERRIELEQLQITGDNYE